MDGEGNASTTSIYFSHYGRRKNTHTHSHIYEMYIDMPLTIVRDGILESNTCRRDEKIIRVLMVYQLRVEEISVKDEGPWDLCFQLLPRLAASGL